MQLRGRIVLRRISESDKVAALRSDGARLLYTWLLTHVDINGCHTADVVLVRAKIMPKLRKFIWQVRWYLSDLKRVGLIVLYSVDKDRFLHIPDFVERQPCLNPKKEAIGTIPLPKDGTLQSKYGVTLGQVGSNSGVTSHLNVNVSVKSKLNKKNVKKKIYVKFLEQKVSPTVRVLALCWNDVVRKLVVGGNSGDVACLRDITYWLADGVDQGRFEIVIFDVAWEWAKDAADAKVPIAVFQAKLKKELGYECKSKRGKE